MTGKRVLVTGGSKGIGLAVARELAGRGATVIVAARNVDAVGADYQAVALDVADANAWPGAMEQVGEELHGLVAAAGVLGPIGPLEEVDPAEVAATIATNLLGTMLALHHAIPRLSRSGGRAVTFSGGGGTSPRQRYDAYAASKAAVVRLTENVAAAGAIEVNCVAPGLVATGIHRGTPDAERAAGGASPEEAAELVCFLLSEEASGITGRLISARWDPWRDESFRARLREDPDLGTLRRIDDVLFRRAT
jgi:NAD(P)-dependent dehydrogenase (short-subunit alcohol dehydrogenase family)